MSLMGNALGLSAQASASPAKTATARPSVQPQSGAASAKLTATPVQTPGGPGPRMEPRPVTTTKQPPAGGGKQQAQTPPPPMASPARPPASPIASPAGGGGPVGSVGGGPGGSAPQASAGAPQYDSMREYQDQAFQHGMSRLQPQIDQQNRQAQQQLVNQGIDPNSAAGRNLLDQNARNQNDQRSSLLTSAMGLGLQAQNQAFGQSLQNANLRQQNTFNQRADALQRAGLNQQGQQFNANLAQRESEFGRNLGQRESEFGRNRQDANTDRFTSLLGSALGMDQNIFGQNVGYGQQQFNARQAIAGSVPGYNPAMIDVNGSANAATNSQQAAFNQQQALNPWNTLGQAGVAAAGAWSDRRLKTNIKQVGTLGEFNVYEWDWNDDAKELGLEGRETGFIAQELPGELVSVDPSGYLKVDYARAVAA